MYQLPNTVVQAVEAAKLGLSWLLDGKISPSKGVDIKPFSKTTPVLVVSDPTLFIKETGGPGGEGEQWLTGVLQDSTSPRGKILDRQRRHVLTTPEAEQATAAKDTENLKIVAIEALNKVPSVKVQYRDREVKVATYPLGNPKDPASFGTAKVHTTSKPIFDLWVKLLLAGDTPEKALAVLKDKDPTSIIDQSEMEN